MSGRVAHTDKPWTIFYTEEQPGYAEARKREKYLKSAAGKRFLKKLLPLNQ